MANNLEVFKASGLLSGDLAKYKANLQSVQTTAPQVGGLPFLKLGKDGVWRYGQDDTEVQDGSEWAVNPATLKKGFIAWAREGGTKPLGKVMKPILLGDLPRESDLPDVGTDWSENVSIELTCLNGDDEGKTVAYASNAMGGVEAFHVLVSHLIHQIDTDKTKLVPIVTLTNQGYQHSNRSYGIKGWIVKPVFEVVDWMGNDEAPVEVGDEEPDEKAEPPKATARAAAPARAAAARGPVPARGSAIPRNAPANGRGAAAPPRRAAATKAEVEDTSAGETIVPDDEAEASPVVRRRRRVVTDVE